MTTFVGILLAAFLVSTLATPIASRLAYRIGALDVPGGRKVHERTTPRLGGLAVALGFAAGLGSGFLASPKLAAAWPPGFAGVLMGAALLVALGVWDDARGLTARAKLPVQILAAHLAWTFGVKFAVLSNLLGLLGDTRSLALPEAVSYLATMLWIVGVTNAMNFIDGLDALASGLAFIVSTTLLFVSIQLGQVFYAGVYAALMGAVLGFGRFNRYPARIFLGDSGSLFLGYMLATTSILANHKVTTLGSILIPVVALGVPVADTLYAVVRRFVGGKSPFQADRGHIHHRLLELGYTPREAVWVIYLLSIALSVAVFFLLDAQNDFAALVLLLLTAGSFTMARKLELLHLDRFHGEDRGEGKAAGAPQDGEPVPPPADPSPDRDALRSE